MKDTCGFNAVISVTVTVSQPSSSNNYNIIIRLHRLIIRSVFAVVTTFVRDTPRIYTYVIFNSLFFFLLRFYGVHTNYYYNIMYIITKKISHTITRQRFVYVVIWTVVLT